MGAIRPALAAALICAITWRDEPVYAEALDRLMEHHGPVEMESPVFAFDMTDYYTPEMGPGLSKRFVCFREPVVQDGLAAVKLLTNDIETALANGHCRRINLDPGYVTLAKLVLASTKDFSHRLYIGQGIYAESTLRYKDGTFHPADTAFPDYRTSQAIAFFNDVREYVKRERGRWATHNG